MSDEYTLRVDGSHVVVSRDDGATAELSERESEVVHTLCETTDFGDGLLRPTAGTLASLGEAFSARPATRSWTPPAFVQLDGKRHAVLAGPFRDDHQGALDTVEAAKRLAQDLDPKAVFYGFGTARTDYAYHRPGVLNERLGLAP